MRVWKQLKEWVKEETQSAQKYRRLAETAAHYPAGAGFRQDPELQLDLDWRNRQQPNEACAVRYHPGYNVAIQFLEESLEDGTKKKRTREDARREAEQIRQRELERARELAEERAQRIAEQEQVARKPDQHIAEQAPASVTNRVGRCSHRSNRTSFLSVSAVSYCRREKRPCHLAPTSE